MHTKNKKPAKKKTARLIDHDTARTLSDSRLVFETFTACMREGDHEAALEVLAASLRHLNKSKLEREYNIPRRSIYNLLRENSVPRMDLVAKVCHAIDAEAGVKAFRVRN